MVKYIGNYAREGYRVYRLLVTQQQGLMKSASLK